ncbi:hypothetical protein IFM89_027171 [Coptis chinensis]|uniref:Uncharacterized protein n=1 Tax=Coptis chinensis TaxID=261450 RepID=A0A835M1W0_9MAGN|nr:hypothetical protein IFM89_027171 [Coptis chinensis]
MLWESRRCDISVVMKIAMETKGVIVPGKEEFADNAIIAIKEEKSIAVPPDTLYGSACDAWVGVVFDIERFAVTLPHGLPDNLLPGPLTVVII